jgi:hypothetical protein
MNRTLCAHCGKEMAREENKVYLEVRPSMTFLYMGIFTLFKSKENSIC